MRRLDVRRQGGFSFIEILVVMGIISVLVSMVVVIIPTIQEKARQTKSKDNVRSLATLMLSRRTERVTGGWPRYSGKNFVLSTVAFNLVDARNKQNLEIFFSPGDEEYTLDDVNPDRYKEVTKDSLKRQEDFHELTSYAGRRNGDKEFRITPNQEKQGTMIICDDDDGPLHHPDGIVAAYSNGSVRFMPWDEMDMRPPENPDQPEPFLGDEAENDELRKMLGN